MRDPNCEVILTLDMLVSILKLGPQFALASNSLIDEREGVVRVRLFAQHLPEANPTDALALVTPTYHQRTATEAILKDVTITPGPARTDGGA